MYMYMYIYIFIYIYIYVIFIIYVFNNLFYYYVNPPINSQQIRILHKTNKKLFVVNCWPSGKYVHVLYMYSILGRGSSCFNYCLNSAWHGGDQFVALLRWYGSPGFFDSGLQLICIFWSLVSHFPLDNTHRFSGVQVWWVCLPVKHTNTMVI